MKCFSSFFALLFISGILSAGVLLPRATSPESGDASTFLAESDLIGEGLYESDWFGVFYLNVNNWVYHENLNWIKIADASTGIFVWSESLGWAWTSREAYPNFYLSGRRWISLTESTALENKFYDYMTRGELSDSLEIGSDLDYFPIPEKGETYTWSYSVNDGQTTSGVVEGINMDFIFNSMTVKFSGSSLLMDFNTNASFGLSFYESGRWFTGSGVVALNNQEQYLKDFTGLYLKEAYSYFDYSMNISGIGIQMELNSVARNLNSLSINFPWQQNINEIPIGTSFTQSIDGLYTSNEFYVVGDGIPAERDFYEITSSGSITWTLIDRISSYSQEGRIYNNVIKIRQTVSSRDPQTKQISTFDFDIWLAPGVGLIRSLEFDRDLGVSIDMKLIDSNLL